MQTPFIKSYKGIHVIFAYAEKSQHILGLMPCLDYDCKYLFYKAKLFCLFIELLYKLTTIPHQHTNSLYT